MPDLPSTSPSQPSSASSPHASSTGWSWLTKFPPSICSSCGAPNVHSRSPSHPPQPLSTIFGCTRSSSRASLHDSIVRASNRQQRSQSLTSQKSDGGVTSFTFDSLNLESIMLPLQLLKSSCLEFLELDRKEKRNWRRSIVQRPPPSLLYATYHSDWLSLEMENLVCRAHELSAQAIRHRQPASRESNNASNEPNLWLTLRDDDEREAPVVERQPLEGSDFKTRLRLKPKSRIWCHTSMGRLIIELIRPLGDSPNVNISDVLFTIKVSFLPRSQQRTIGLSALFQRHLFESQACQISPRLRTFNVIPNDSHVIDCIRRNDLPGVQHLFTDGKASTLDVDSCGYSLLSVSSLSRVREANRTDFRFSIL